METEAAEEVLCQECGGKHAGPCGIEKVISALSVSLTKGFEGATRWSISDTTAGLLKLYKRHAFEGAEDTIIGDVVHDRAILEEIQEWLHWSIAAYEKDRASLLTNLLVKKLVSTSAINQPAYFIAVYHAQRCVVMGIRGTYNTTDILTDLNPRTEPFQHGAAHTGILGAAKWLLEKEGQTLQNLLHDYSGYKLVLTGHSLGPAVAALLTMMLHTSGAIARLPSKAVSKMERLLPTSVTSVLEKSFPTTVGIASSEIMCWGYGCAPCVDLTLAEQTPYIHNVVLQDDVVPRVNPAAIETLRDEIQETSLSQGLKDGKMKKMVESIERVNFSKAFKTGYHKIQNAQMLHKQQACSESDSDKSQEEKNMTIRNESIKDKVAMESSMDDPRTEARIAAKAIVAVAEGPSVSKEELERRRLFAPGNLYHIRRREIEVIGLPMPAKPVLEEGEEPPRNPKFKYHVIRGSTPSSRFKRIILSSTMLSDHSCFNIRDGLLDAMQPDQGMEPSMPPSNPHVVIE